jgi:hypothetical protein
MWLIACRYVARCVVSVTECTELNSALRKSNMSATGTQVYKGRPLIELIEQQGNILETCLSKKLFAGKD